MTELDKQNETSLRRWKAWLLIIALWTVPGLLSAIQMYFLLASGGHPISGWQALLWNMPGWYVWAILTPVILRLGRIYPIHRAHLVNGLLVHLPISVVFALIHIGCTVINTRLAGPDDFRVRPLLLSYWWYFTVGFHLELLTYWAILGVGYFFDYYQRYRERELAASRLETQLARAQLQVLMMQLHPHFLFNTLHTISSTMHQDVEVADNMITHLSDLLRITLENVGVHEVSLKQELDLLNRYLQIEKARFRERLEIDMRIDPVTLDARVPNLLLQPLVENAIRHGLAVYSTVGRIEIISSREIDMLHIEVRDNGRGLPEEARTLKEGVGLSNIQARLQQLYGEKHHFGLFNSPAGGLVVRIEIPFQEGQRKSR
jgi:two-component system LytT family sensor kinase